MIDLYSLSFICEEQLGGGEREGLKREGVLIEDLRYMMQNSVSLLQMWNIYPIMKPLRLNKWRSEPILP